MTYYKGRVSAMSSAVWKRSTLRCSQQGFQAVYALPHALDDLIPLESERSNRKRSNSKRKRGGRKRKRSNRKRERGGRKRDRIDRSRRNYC